ncbi:flavodoxin family protein [Methanobacterium oryzae]|uniref:flavodoxin family protein n=1 Tax=Methanobacterium oryzae TaxID=69540 RepID=UPI003D1B9128
MKAAILYYSRTGKTAIAAKALAEKIGGDLIEIRDLKNRKGVLGWLRAGRDGGSSKTTDIEPSSFDTSIYDTICFGTPVWNGHPTPAFNTMVKSFEITGKDIILFMTCGGKTCEKPLNIMRDMVKSEGGNVIKTFEIPESGKKSGEDIKTEINNITF